MLNITKAEGMYLWDKSGKQYLDLTTMSSSAILGHNHPRITKVATDQAQRITEIPLGARSLEIELLISDLCTFTGYESAYITISRLQALDSAINAARLWGERIKGISRNSSKIIICRGSFYDTFTSQRAGILSVRFGDLENLKQIMAQDVVAVIIEPVQLDDNLIVPPVTYLNNVSRLCHDQKLLLIVDESLSGFGRMGGLFAHDRITIQPDLVILGRALTGGTFPIAAVLSPYATLSLLNPSGFPHTHSINPLIASIARETINIIRKDMLFDQSTQICRDFIINLKELKNSFIKSVIGEGFLIEFIFKGNNFPSYRFFKELLKKGIVCETINKNIIRISPPLIITQNEINWVIDSIKEISFSLDLS